MKTICVIGSLNYDLVTTVDTVPSGGETIRAHSFETYHGGKGANQAYALRRLTSPNETVVAMAGCVGTDTFGHELLRHLESSGVDTSRVKQLKFDRTGTATILVEKSGENRIMVFPGANGNVSEDAALAALSGLSPDFVVLQNEIPLATTMAVLRHVAPTPVLSVFNPSPLPETPISEWPEVGLLCVNESEASALSGKPVHSRESAEAALPTLLKSCQICVITLGSNGVVWQARTGKHQSDRPEFEPAKRVEKVVDTTGAGDTFLAALVSRLASAETEPLRSHISFAQAAAAIAVTRPGAASSIPTLDEVSVE